MTQVCKGLSTLFALKRPIASSLPERMYMIFFANLFSCLSKQLLSVTTPGGSGRVEDQTDLLGFSTKRSKLMEHTVLT